MKTLTFALLLFTTVTYAQKTSKFELIAGLRSGFGYSWLNTVYPNGTLTDSNGYYVATGQYISKQSGYYIPAKAELLFGVKDFRIGYMFGYTYTHYSFNTFSFKPKSPKVPTLASKPNLLLHSFSHMLRIEYNWPVRIKAAKLLVGAVAGIGGYHGKLNNKARNIKTDFGIYKNKIVVMAGINLELVKGPFSLVLSPVYLFQDFQYKEIYFDSVTQHNFGIDVGLRLNLLQVAKKKEYTSTSISLRESPVFGTP